MLLLNGTGRKTEVQENTEQPPQYRFRKSLPPSSYLYQCARNAGNPENHEKFEKAECLTYRRHFGAAVMQHEEGMKLDSTATDSVSLEAPIRAAKGAPAPRVWLPSADAVP